MRYRQIHNLYQLAVGPSPASGYHYADYNNEKHNNSNLTQFDSNLVNPIDRVYEMSYALNIERENLMQLGQSPLVKEVILNRPTFSLNFSYWIDGIKNEVNQGFDINRTIFSGVEGDGDTFTDIYAPKYNYHPFLLSNLTGDNKDSRNIFLSFSPDNEDINNRISDIDNKNGTHPSLLTTMAFGNCYCNGYGVRYAVGEVPSASVSYICENIMVYSSGSGVNIPAIHPKSGQLISGVYFTIPRSETLTNPASLLASRTILTLLSPENEYFGIYNSNLPVMSFDLSIDIPREALQSIGYVSPLDRKVNFPIFANINCAATISGYSPDSLVDILSQNKEHNLKIQSLARCSDEVQIEYLISGAKFNGLSESRIVNDTLVTNFGFNVQIDPYINKGVFISGKMNNDYTPMINCLLLSNNKTGFLFLENNNLLLV